MTTPETKYIVVDGFKYRRLKPRAPQKRYTLTTEQKRDRAQYMRSYRRKQKQKPCPVCAARATETTPIAEGSELFIKRLVR